VTYASLADLTDRYGEAELIRLTDIEAVRNNAINETAVTSALTDASNEINEYVGLRNPAPPALITIECRIAYYLLQRNLPNEAARLGYEDAIRRLKDISAGRAVLPLADAEATAAETAADSEAIPLDARNGSDSLGTFNDSAMRGY
jgi:phage gp36-like protein